MTELGEGKTEADLCHSETTWYCKQKGHWSEWNSTPDSTPHFVSPLTFPLCSVVSLLPLVYTPPPPPPPPPPSTGLMRAIAAVSSNCPKPTHLPNSSVSHRYTRLTLPSIFNPLPPLLFLSSCLPSFSCLYILPLTLSSLILPVLCSKAALFSTMHIGLHLHGYIIILVFPEWMTSYRPGEAQEKKQRYVFQFIVNISLLNRYLDYSSKCNLCIGYNSKSIFIRGIVQIFLANNT